MLLRTHFSSPTQICILFVAATLVGFSTANVTAQDARDQIYAAPRPLTELPIQSDPTALQSNEETSGELVAYSIMMLSGESEVLSGFLDEHLDGNREYQGQGVFTWLHTDPVPVDLRHLAEDVGLATDFPTIVCVAGTTGRFCKGGEVPLTRGWKVNREGVAEPIIEFHTFGLSIDITPRLTDDDEKLTSELVVEDRELIGTEKSTIETPAGGQFTIDVPQFDSQRRMSAGYWTQPGESIVLQYSMPDENRTTVLVISPRRLDPAATTSDANAVSGSAAPALNKLHALPGRSVTPAHRLARELGDPKSFKPGQAKRR